MEKITEVERIFVNKTVLQKNSNAVWGFEFRLEISSKCFFMRCFVRIFRICCCVLYVKETSFVYRVARIFICRPTENTWQLLHCQLQCDRFFFMQKRFPTFRLLQQIALHNRGSS